jgi:hypothetical protein
MTGSNTVLTQARQVLLRDSKDRIATATIALCEELQIRALVGGAPVLNAHGLLSPIVTANASMIVDPVSIDTLRAALAQRGWRDAGHRRSFRVLPSARLTLVQADEPAGLILYSVIPGFFADPAETFEILWGRRKELILRGHPVPVLGRITSAILASHDGLDGRASRAQSRFDYFAQQFAELLDDRERMIASDLIQRMGGCAEMRRLLLALGREPCEYTLPSVAYVEWRLRVAGASDQLRRVVSWLELGPDGRAALRESGRRRLRSPRKTLASVLSLPRTAVIIAGTRHRRGKTA